MENMFENPLSEKQTLRKKIEEEIGKISDKLGMKIDSEIKEAVIVLKLSGFETSMSCGGHVDRALPYPWIDIIAPGKKNVAYEELQKKYEVAKVVILSDQENELKAKIDEEIREIERRLNDLLNKFYANSESDRLLMIRNRSSALRLQPVRAEEFPAIKSGSILEESEKQKRLTFLNESRTEMSRFISFLNSCI